MLSITVVIPLEEQIHTSTLNHELCKVRIDQPIRIKHLLVVAIQQEHLHVVVTQQVLQRGAAVLIARLQAIRETHVHQVHTLHQAAVQAAEAQIAVEAVVVEAREVLEEAAEEDDNVDSHG